MSESREIAIHCLRVNVKSLAAEARFIRQEIKRCRLRSAKDELHYHRLTRLRTEARLAHLALAYVKGRNYRQAENKAKQSPDAAALGKKIHRFVRYSERPGMDVIEKWLAA